MAKPATVGEYCVALTGPPEDLLRRVIADRLDEFERGGVTWM